MTASGSLFSLDAVAWRVEASRKSADLRIEQKLVFSRNAGYDFDIAVRVGGSLLALLPGKGRPDWSYREAFARTRSDSTGSEGKFVTGANSRAEGGVKSLKV